MNNLPNSNIMLWSMSRPNWSVTKVHRVLQKKVYGGREDVQPKSIMLQHFDPIMSAYLCTGSLILDRDLTLLLYLFQKFSCDVFL